MPENVKTDTFEWFRDNPSTRWDGDIRDVADWFAENRYTPTAYLRARVPPERLRDVPGKMGEHLHRTTAWSMDLTDRLSNSMQERGYVGAPVLICVEYDGQPFIYEGNHRIRAAAQIGLPSIPVEVRYLGGCEVMPGIWRPIDEPLPLASNA